jgi:two-component system, OmpR family, phosphate regulon sensor histidine kinase PhoR
MQEILSRLLNRIPGWIFLATSLVFFYGLYQSHSCYTDIAACGQLITLVLGLLAVQGLYLIRPWLKVRQKILALAMDLRLLDRLPEIGRDQGLEQAAEMVIATLGELQADARRTTRAVQALEQSQIDLLDSLPEPVMVLDHTLHIMRANDSARELFPTLFFSQALQSLLRDPELLAACQTALQTGNEQNIEFKLTAPVERVFIALLKPITHSGFGLGEAQTALLLTLNDITAIKRSEQMRADFVANVSHELRTPLASLIGFIETLQGPASKDPEAQKKFLAIMANQSQAMARLVNDLLSLSRIEMREHHQPEDPVNIEALLHGIALELQIQLQQRGMRLSIHLPENLPEVQGDEDELHQVFTNLITNAIRYGHAQTEIVVEGELTKIPAVIPGQKDDAMVAIAVQDFGIGIAAVHIPRLTERFYRIDKARSREGGGTGLGLAIVKHIINRHRGVLTIESEENQGSVFRVFLPVYSGPPPGHHA